MLLQLPPKILYRQSVSSVIRPSPALRHYLSASKTNRLLLSLKTQQGATTPHDAPIHIASGTACMPQHHAQSTPQFLGRLNPSLTAFNKLGATAGKTCPTLKTVSPSSATPYSPGTNLSYRRSKPGSNACHNTTRRAPQLLGRLKLLRSAVNNFRRYCSCQRHFAQKWVG